MTKVILKYIAMCCCLFIASCPKQTPKNIILPTNTLIILTHTGQTKLNVEYEKIYISEKNSFVQSLKKKYSFEVTDKELRQLLLKISHENIKHSGKREKETNLLVVSGSEIIQKQDSIWNLSDHVKKIETFIDSKLALPFRLPYTVSKDLVIEMQESPNLFSEEGKYIRTFTGASYISIVKSHQRRLHTFILSQEELQKILDILREQNITWLNENEQYGKAKTIISNNDYKWEKNAVVAACEQFLIRQKKIVAFPSKNKIPENLQIDIKYRDDSSQIKKEIYVSTTSGYYYFFDVNNDRKQREIPTNISTLEEIFNLVYDIKTTEEDDHLKMIISWQDSHVEKDISLSSFTKIEQKILEIIKRNTNGK